MTPVTSVGIANGMSTTVDSQPAPGNSYRTSTYATIVPKTTFTIAVTAARTIVSTMASLAPGAHALRNDRSPFAEPAGDHRERSAGRP